MKKYEIATTSGERKTVSAERVTVESGAVVFYRKRGAEDREEIAAAWGPGQWQLVLALSEAGNPIVKISQPGAEQ